jgi:hypothetical protein
LLEHEPGIKILNFALYTISEGKGFGARAADPHHFTFSEQEPDQCFGGGAAQKSTGSATLFLIVIKSNRKNENYCKFAGLYL